jgi:hypothetical protein
MNEAVPPDTGGTVDVLPAAIIGGGPAGLMAAQVLSEAGVPVHLFDTMPSVGRKFLLAGRGGLNLTHSEDFEPFVGRYGARREAMRGLLHDLDGPAVRAWAVGLGVDTFVGTSGRVFPTDFKAAPLLRAWLHRLRHPVGGRSPLPAAVQFHMRHRWVALARSAPAADAPWALTFQTPSGPKTVDTHHVVLALGGASWARLGSDGAWVPVLSAQGVGVAPLRPANGGFEVRGGWSAHFRERYEGQPFKSVALHCVGPQGEVFNRKGEFVATATGVEGSLVYAASSLLREVITAQGTATLHLDLLPDMPHSRVLAHVQHPRGARSLSSHLKSRLGLQGIKMGLLHEVLDKTTLNDPATLASAVKAVPLVLSATRPLDEAISTAGGVVLEDLDEQLMVRALPGVFCAGEMLDWEAPTGGYLLTACLATGQRAGRGVLARMGVGAGGNTGAVAAQPG